MKQHLLRLASLILFTPLILSAQKDESAPQHWETLYQSYRLDELESSLAQAPRRHDPHKAARAHYQQKLSQMRRLLGHVTWLEVADSTSMPLSAVASYMQAQGVGITPTDSLGLGYLSDRRDRYITPMYQSSTGLTRLVAGGLVAGQAIPSGDLTDDAPFISSIPDSLLRPSYPALAPDGITLYFSAESSQGLGGRDLYMTRRRSDGEYLQPVPLGLPYNSPADDYLLAFNAECNVGYLVSGRYCTGDTVTVYRFLHTGDTQEVPSNAPALLRQYGMLCPYSVTQRAGIDYASMVQPCGRATQQPSATSHSEQVAIVIAPDVVYRQRSDFYSLQAAALYDRYLPLHQQIVDGQQQLDQLRSRYRTDRSVGADILRLERDLPHLQREARELLAQIRLLEIRERP